MRFSVGRITQGPSEGPLARHPYITCSAIRWAEAQPKQAGCPAPRTPPHNTIDAVWAIPFCPTLALEIKVFYYEGDIKKNRGVS